MPKQSSYKMSNLIVVIHKCLARRGERQNVWPLEIQWIDIWNKFIVLYSAENPSSDLTNSCPWHGLQIPHLTTASHIWNWRRMAHLFFTKQEITVVRWYSSGRIYTKSTDRRLQHLFHLRSVLFGRPVECVVCNHVWRGSRWQNFHVASTQAIIQALYDTPIIWFLVPSRRVSDQLEQDVELPFSWRWIRTHLVLGSSLK